MVIPQELTMSVTPLKSQTSDRFEGIRLEDLSEYEKTTLVNLALAVLAPKHLSSDLIASPDTSRRYSATQPGRVQERGIRLFLSRQPSPFDR